MRDSRMAWAVAAALVVAWVALGALFGAGPLGWLLKAVTAGAVIAPAAWVAIYTAQGATGAGKWWKSDIGTNMVWLELAAIVTNGVICAEVWFPRSLPPPLAAWVYAGGLLAGTLIITWRSVIWLRAARRGSPLLTHVRDLEAENAALRDALAGRP